MLNPAIEVALDAGKISTSLLQRRLKLGYGRAAKLIDRMEQLGIYEVIEEDVSLCEYVCPSKVEIQKIIREGIELMMKEM